MKKIVTTAVAVAALALFASSALAVNLMSESFSYPNGNLTPNGGWLVHSGSGIDIQVSTGRAVGDNNNSDDDSRAFTAQPNTSPTYACFEVAIPNPGASPKTNYFAHLKDSGTTNFVARVYVMPAGATGFTFGLSHSSTSAVAPVAWSVAPLLYDKSYFIVIKYDPALNTSTLWVNPSSEASPNITQTLAGSVFSISTFALREAFNIPTMPAGTPSGTGTWKFSVDNLGVGTTFSDACAQVTPAQGSTWGRLKTIYKN